MTIGSMQYQKLREHLCMMLQAMQVDVPPKASNEDLRDLVEKEKIIFLRKLQAEKANA